jgi:YVTN family beta-propeller protein
VTNRLDGTVSRIDPVSRRVTDTIEVDGLSRDIAVGAGGVWVTTDAA